MEITPSLKRPHGFLAAFFASWFIYLALDFWSHAVLLATYWRDTAGYWRPPDELFRLIPAGYATFGIYCAALIWLLVRLYPDRLTPGLGLSFGAVAGLVYNGSGSLASYSVFRMPLSAVFFWTACGVVESALAGAVAVWVMIGERPTRRAVAVIGVAIALFVLGVIAQSLFVPHDAFQR